MLASIPGEKQCELCGCMFVNKAEPDIVRCTACRGKGPESAGAGEKFIYQDIKRSDIELKLNACLEKLDVIMKLLKGPEKKAPEYSKKCEMCGSVFVSDQPATRYCPDCKEKK